MRVFFGWSPAMAALVALATSAQAGSITLSDASSDLTPVSQLDATLDFVVGEFDVGNAGDELQITLTNTGVDFNINELFANTSTNITSLTLLSATHSVSGDVFADWNPVETGQSADGFGIFDYALTNAAGETDPTIAQPGNSIVFVLDIDSLAAASMSDFIEANAMGYVGAAKFVHGPDDPEAPGFEDSAYGAAVPEPDTALLLGLGLVTLAARGRARTRRYGSLRDLS